MNVGKAIKHIRSAQEQQLKTIAERAEITPGMLSLIESGDRDPSLTVLQRIAQALNIPVEVLLLFNQRVKGSLQSDSKKVRETVDLLKSLSQAEERLKRHIAND